MTTMTPKPWHTDGLRLARELEFLRAEQPFVLAIPRGGVLVADAVARALEAPLDVVIARRVLAPNGVAFAAIAEGGALVVDDGVVSALRLPSDEIEHLVAQAQDQHDAMLERIRGTWPLPVLADRTVILVDDAVITGLTMRAAIAAVRARGARRIVVATPLATTDVAAVRAAGAAYVIGTETMPGPVALRLHDARVEPCPPPNDAEIHDVIARELRAVGADPFAGLTIDGI